MISVSAEVDEDDRQEQSRAHRHERLTHRLTLASNDDLGAGGHLAETIDRLLHRVLPRSRRLTPQLTSMTRWTV